MDQKFALKRLTQSDLTLFEWQFRNSASNQKAINLNADIFVERLYPALPVLTRNQGNKLPLDLYLYGPGLAPELNLQRKIIKGDTYKNWRLNGEFIFNPDDNPLRFNSLVAGDLALFRFEGETVPVAARVVFMAQQLEADASVFQVFNEYLGTRKMAAVELQELQDLVSSSRLPEQHPLLDLLLDEVLEDAALGGIQGTTRLLSRRAGRPISQLDLKKARENAEDIGRQGEEIVNVMLEKLMEQGTIQNYEWTAKINAVSPFDFKHTDASDALTLLDVKTTKSGFAQPLHISLSELKMMATAECPYDLYRVYGITERTARLRIARDVRSWALSIIDIFGNLPTGITPDSISVQPSVLAFQEEIVLTIPDNLE